MDTPQLEHQFRTSVRWSLAGSVGATVFQFLQMLVFARLSGPEQAGDYALAATFIGLLSPLAEAGLSQALVSARSLTPRHFVTLTWINFTVSVLVLLLLTSSSTAIANWYDRPALAGLLSCMGGALLFTPFGAQYGALLARDLHFDLAAKIQVYSGLVSFATVAGLAFAGWGAWAMAAGFVVKSVTSSLGSWWAGRGIIRVNWLEISPWREIKPYLRFGFYDLSTRWTDFLANWLDKFIVGKWLGAAALGFYQLAFTIGALPTARLGYVVTRVAFPLFARAGDDMAQREQIFRRASRDVCLLLFPLYLSLMLFARELIVLFYGEKWLPAAVLLQAFSAAGLIRTLAAVFPQLTLGIGKPQWQFLWLLGWAAGANLCLSAVLWLHPTVEAAAWSRGAGKVFFEIPLLAWLAGRCGVSFRQLLGYAGQMLVWLLPAAGIVYLSALHLDADWVALLLKASLWSAFLLWFYLKGPFKDDFRALASSFIKSKTPPG